MAEASADTPPPDPAPPAPARWQLVNAETGEVNDILYDGVSPYAPPDGWTLQRAPD